MRQKILPRKDAEDDNMINTIHTVTPNVTTGLATVNNNNAYVE